MRPNCKAAEFWACPHNPRLMFILFAFLFADAATLRECLISMSFLIQQFFILKVTQIKGSNTFLAITEC